MQNKVLIRTLWGNIIELYFSKIIDWFLKQSCLECSSTKSLIFVPIGNPKWPLSWTQIVYEKSLDDLLQKFYFSIYLKNGIIWKHPNDLTLNLDGALLNVFLCWFKIQDGHHHMTMFLSRTLRKMIFFFCRN